jgi:drug/metabolite transporter (DMT)-like permease
VLLRAAVGRERTPPIALAGVAVGFVGVGLLLLPSARPEGATAAGVALVLVAAVSWATGSFLSPRLELPADPLVSTGWQMLAGGLALLAGAIATGEPGDVHPSAVSASAALAFAYLVVAGSLVAYTAYAWLLQHAPLTQVSTYAYVNPLVAVLLGALILDEALAPLTIAGAALIVAAVALIVTRQSRVASRNAAG